MDGRMDFDLDMWANLPDVVLLHIFSFLPVQDLLVVSQTCKSWFRVAMDDFLWKDLFYLDFKLDRTIGMAMGKDTWQSEYKRLYYHTPLIESEVLQEHRDQVLHVSFSHNGKMFATSSKDGFIKIWDSTYPATVIYYEDMRWFPWRYVQYSQFNESDTLLMVSGAHIGNSNSLGEIAVFNLTDGFELQCRVLNKPYDIFGTWYNDSYLLSGTLHWMGDLTSCSTLILNKASQALDSEQESVVMTLFKLHNVNASSIRTIMVANCSDSTSHDQGQALPEGHVLCSCKDSQSRPHMHGAKQNKNQRQGQTIQRIQMYEEQGMGVQLLEVDMEAHNGHLAAIEYNNKYRLAESEDFRMSEAGSIQYLKAMDTAMEGDQESESLFRNMFENYSEHSEKCLPDLHQDRLNGACSMHTSKSDVMDTACSDRYSKTNNDASDNCPVLNKEELCQIFQGDKEAFDSVNCVTSGDSASKSCLKCMGLLQDNYRANYNKYRDLVSDSTDDDDYNNDMAHYEHSTNVWASGEMSPARNEDPSHHTDMSTSPQRQHSSRTDSEQSQSSQNPVKHKGNEPPGHCSAVDNLFGSSDGQGGASGTSYKPKEKYLIFTTGMKTYTPHQIGIKKIGILEEKFGKEGSVDLMPRVENNVHDPNQEPDTVDHLIELHGHIIGMCLSPDHRYLYVNSRPWPQGYNIEDPLYPPPIAQEIDIHVIDLQTMQEVGTMHRAHKAYTPNDECFFIFLDVCDEYVASGAEDKHGYLWDRHYGVCLAKFAHSDVVNSVAFKPTNPEILITASDDFSIKIWRSRNEVKKIRHRRASSQSID